MSFARITLDSGRTVVLATLKISSTYAGVLEGYPTREMNDGLLRSLAKRQEYPYRPAPPVHVIPPRRSNPGPDRPGAFGPLEVLPPVCCEAHFTSGPVDEGLDAVLHRSWLDVVWFQDDVAAPIVDLVTAAVAGLPWDALAEDDEI